MNKKNKAFQVYKSEKSKEAFNHFKDIRNEVQMLIYTAKKNYFADKLEENKHDSK